MHLVLGTREKRTSKAMFHHSDSFSTTCIEYTLYLKSNTHTPMVNPLPTGSMYGLEILGVYVNSSDAKVKM